MAMIKAPWTPKQIDALERFQHLESVHPFTCPLHSDKELVATHNGWICRYCDYCQDWANDFMMLERKKEP
jgi:hypothetical protein